MEKEFEALVNTLNKFQGVKIIDTSKDFSWIHFKIDNGDVLDAVSTLVIEVKDYYPCDLLVLTKKEKSKEISYQIVIDEKNRLQAIQLLDKKLENLLGSDGNVTKAKHRELGLPDMSLLTIRQMAAELKRRNGLTFALVWIENAERDNIAIEGSGNPTQLVGLLTRGSHMAIEWADKNIKFFKPREEE
jgi:hypothetical protein